MARRIASGSPVPSYPRGSPRSCSQGPMSVPGMINKPQCAALICTEEHIKNKTVVLRGGVSACENKKTRCDNKENITSITG